MNKACTVCGVVKDLSEFHKKKEAFDGVRADCKVCHCAKRRAYAAKAESKEKRAAYQRSEAGRACKKRYRSSEHGKAKHREYVRRAYQEKATVRERVNAYQRSWRKTPTGRAQRAEERASMIAKGRYRVYHQLHAALRSGKISRQPCESCGSQKSQAHHDDYSKPLDVRWLCAKHHAEHHREHV
jgi:hypothetical protein